VLALVVLWAVSLLSALLHSREVWAASGRSRTGWVVGMALFGWAAGIAYLLLVRPALRSTVPR
jgi:hypothetical protein